MIEAAKKNLPSYPSLRRVTQGDGFFGDFTKKIALVSAWDILQKFLRGGILENYERVASGKSGGHAGYPWHHGLICECIRGISDLLVHHYNAETDAEIDRIIDAIGRAQSADPDGFLNPYTTLMCPHERWGKNGGNLIWLHETYNTGCLAEAAVHHYEATGKTTLLAIAVKACNYLADFIGDAPRHNVVPEHSLPENALLKLYRLLDKNTALARSVGARPAEYLRLAEYFIDHKGDNETRYSEPKFMREYSQDHRPAAEQREAVGHAVRSMLFAEGVAALANERGREDLRTAARAIWQDITETKLHINGCVGTHKNEEKFGNPYELPNNAYLETCAGVGLIFFALEIFRMTRDASVWDTVESTLCNVIPASVSADGVHYTYQNPLQSTGDYERWEWHKCPCCPPMLLKLVGMLPTMIFAEQEDHVWLNLLINAELERDNARLCLENNRLTIRTEVAALPLTLHLRIPSWARHFGLRLNGKEQSFSTEQGYAVLRGTFCDGDTVEILYDCPIVVYEAHPFVREDRGLVAIKHGPTLYCAEEIDNQQIPADDFQPTLAANLSPVRNADGTISVGLTNGSALTLLPYREWNNRGRGQMRVWLAQEGAEADPTNLEGWEHRLYRPFREYPN